MQLIASLFDGAGATFEKLYVFLSRAVAKIRVTFVTEHHRGFQDVEWVSNIEKFAFFLQGIQVYTYI